MAINKGNSFNLLGLDFEEAKASLKEFLSSQNTLKDYNFDGSVLNTILDVLAYNTHYQAFYANMVANEAFLDSATLRKSVVSHAKTLGYVPGSIRSAKAILGISAAAATNSTYLTRGTEFLGVDSDGSQFKFVLLDAVYANGETQQFESVPAYEGTLRRITYIYDSNRKSSSYLVIPNNKADVSTIQVRIQASPNDSTGASDVWQYSTDYINLTGDSTVFFLQERELGIYELFFGDNFLGKRPTDGSLVTIEYLETNGETGNGITTFTSSVSGLGNIATLSQSSGGSEPESVSKIKFMAPRFYQSQSRAVTEDDYITKVSEIYPSADSILVYGGETVVPPQYGKVYIAIKTRSGAILTRDEKESVARRLQETASVVSITPEVVDPEYTDVILDCLVTQNPDASNLSASTIKALVTAYLFAYSANELERFGSNLYLSKVTEGINELDTSILGNQTTIKMRKRVSLASMIDRKGFSIDFKNPIYHPHEGHSSVVSTDMRIHTSVAYSTTFQHVGVDGNVYESVTVEDDGFGHLDLVSTDSVLGKRIIYPKIGEIDYDAGMVSFGSKFSPVTSEVFFAVTVQPRNSDLFVFENSVMRVNRGYTDSVSVTVVPQVIRKQNLRG